jgi:hypothetical protein
MIDNVQSATCQQLGLDPPIWTHGGWKAFLDTPEHVRSVIRYIEGNPPKQGMPAQVWPFVREYDHWPFHNR